MGRVLFERHGRLIVTKKARGRNISTKENSKVFNTRLNFNIVSDLSSFSNKSRIKIYNLSKESQNFLEQDNLLVILQVGYGEEELKTIFIGDIDKENGIHTTRQGPDVVTDIECGDAENQIRNAVVSISLAGKVTMRMAVGEVLKSLNLSIGFARRLPNFVFENGYSNSGRIQKVMDDLARYGKFSWSVQNGQIVILRPRETLTQTAYVVSKDTGLIGSVLKTKEKVEFNVLMTPQIRAGVAVRLESKRYGTIDLKVTKVDFVGDTHDGDWLQSVEGEPRKR